MQTEDSRLSEAASHATSWLCDTAMPLWLQHGVDWARGGFYESLTQDHLHPATEFKRLRVLTRQIYVFSEGALQGVESAREAVDHGLHFLFSHARHPDGGFASRQNLHGAIIDPTRDLYDLAFVLFALAHAHRATADPRLKQEAMSLVGFIRDEMKASSGGYLEALPHRLPRRQNPHMHLLEAALACLEHIPDPAFELLADELVDLAQHRFMNQQQSLLFEYFDEKLVEPLKKDGKAIVEPGHHMEWAWLFQEVERVRGRTVAGGDSLARFALTHGLDPKTGMLRGELFEDGSTADASVRLWPHGEWLKAALRVPEIGETWHEAWSAMTRFLNASAPGLWREQWDARACEFRFGPSPASSLYHITTAVMELQRAASYCRPA